MMNPKQRWRHSLEPEQLKHLTWPWKGWGYMPPIKDVFEAFEYVEQAYQPRKILEIGYHAGHSTTYMLETFPNSTVVSYGVSTQARKTMGNLMAHYEDRLVVNLKHSAEIKHDSNQYDFCLIDGNHEYVNALADIKICIDKQIPHMLIDNCEHRSVTDACEDMFTNTNYNKVRSFSYFAQWNNIARFNRIDLWSVKDV